jgi:hypothetical protein
MVTAIHNVSRQMDRIACHADNGYGTPMQAQRRVNIERSPKITIGNVEAASRAYEGADLVMFCKVDAFPVPTVTMGKNGQGLVKSDRVDIDMNQTEQVGFEKKHLNRSAQH